MSEPPREPIPIVQLVSEEPTWVQAKRRQWAAEARAKDIVLSTIFGVVSLLLLLGLAWRFPGVLIAVAILVIPALFRATLAASRKERQAGVAGKLRVFFASVGLMVIVALAGIGAFSATCVFTTWCGLVSMGMGKNYLSDIDAVCQPLSMVVGTLIAAWLTYYFWYRRRGVS